MKYFWKNEIVKKASKILGRMFFLVMASLPVSVDSGPTFLLNQEYALS